MRTVRSSGRLPGGEVSAFGPGVSTFGPGGVSQHALGQTPACG